jgi:dipeptidyl aminopeptidase/acylaminoacyl peptidase
MTKRWLYGLALGATISAAVFFIGRTQSRPDTKHHVVEYGETLHGIHKEYASHVSCEAFQDYNQHLLDREYDYIQPNDTVNIPIPSPEGKLNFTDASWMAEQFHTPSATEEPEASQLEITLRADDGHILSATYSEQAGDDAIVLLHSTGSTKESMNRYVDSFVDQGYSTLQVDFRGHGDSEDHPVTYGATEHQDVHAAISFLEENGKTNIGVYGQSLGGSTALLSQAKHGGADAIIAESLYASLSDIAESYGQHEGHNGTMSELGATVFRSYASVKHGANFFDTDPIDYINDVDVPVMYVHGTGDVITPLRGVKELHENSSPESELVIYETWRHIPSQTGDAPGLQAKMNAFFNEHLD